MTTELQPSSYRGVQQQDNNKCPAPPPPPVITNSNSTTIGGYHRGYPSNGDGGYLKPRRSSPETDDVVSTKIGDAGYDEHQLAAFPKKNAPGYKNDSGYSESLGFESFSLALSERDAASPPPTPPVRDASSLKSVCYGPGHEKYPSWPSAPEQRRYPDDEVAGDEDPLHPGSHRSKSWTDHTNYPKEKPAVYTRPHNKRPNATYTQQLKTVMERCEKIPAETFESRTSRAEPEMQSRMWPSVDREGKVLGDAEYNVPSPPERETLQTKTLNSADLEAYVRNYQEPPVSEVELYGDNDLTEGLEEYTTVQHSQQASYAQSEGYHSYVSSVDSTTTTPFLDRLRRDSEAVSTRPMSSWEDGSSREGRDSVVTTSSGSASSSETLKWHGSMSDVSVSSGMPASRSSGIGTQDRWHNGSMSDISSINGMPPKSGVEDHGKWQDSMIGDHLGSVIDHHHHKKTSSNRLSRESWQVSMNDRNKEHSATEKKWEHSMSKSFHAGMDRSVINDQSSADWENSIHSSMSDVSQSNGSGGTSSKQLIAHSARVQTPQRHHSESVLYLDRERSQQRKLYPVSTSKVDDTNISRHQPSSPQQTQPSVAERISELEKQQNQQLAMRYSYLDPEKRHRIPDPTLKAIQKKALLSFYERHQNQSSFWRSEPHLLAQNQSQPPSPPQQQQQQQQRHSPPPQPPPRPRPLSSRRASSASDYASGNWREKNAGNDKAVPQPQQQQQPPVTNGTSGNGNSSNFNGANNSNSGASDVPQPRHQHSNSCGSLSTDLIGPVIVGPAISIDDWVPERPPKKPHLRTAYSERLPSPDLPPPSPPTVTEVEVLNFDDPLPPPPPELSQNCTAESKVPPPERLENSVLPEAPLERAKERSSLFRRSTRKKAAAETSPTNTSTKTNSLSPNHEHQQHSFHFDYKSNSTVDPHSPTENGFPVSRASARGRSSLRYPSTQKHSLEDRLAPYSLATQMSDLMASKYSDSGNQRAAPQVPVTNSCREAEPKIKRQESFSQDAHNQSYLERQKPRSQMPKNTSPTGGKNKYNQQQQRNFFGLTSKYADSQAPPAYEAVVSTVATAPRHSPPPPPLAPRTPGKKLSPPPRPAPPTHGVHQGSQSKASYLAYRRERGAPDSEGSYKRTMSPNARLDDPVLLKVNHLNNNNHTNNNRNNSQRHEMSKSQSSDALQQQQHRLDDQFSRKSVHNVSYSTTPETEKKRERLSPQSVEVLNDRNRQLERERRKLVAETRLVEDFYRESTTIEMTSQNVEMLNRRNEKQRLAAAVAATEARSPTSSSPKFNDRPSPPSEQLTLDRKVSSPAQTDQTGSSWDRKTPSSSISSSPSRSSPSKSSGSISPVDSGLVARSEVVLRVVNATTNDVASQTECSSIDERTRSDEETESLKPRKKLREEIECEQLSRDLAEQLGPNDKLLPILVPAPEHKKSTDYVVDLFRIEASLQPRPRPRLSIEDPATALDGLENESVEDDKKLESMPTSPMSPSSKSSCSPMSPRSPPCYTTSESKTRFLRRHLQSNEFGDSDDQMSSTDTTAPSATTDNVDLRQKKEELMVRLDKKLVVLRAEQEAVREEGEVNEALGARVSSRISELARPAEASKYRLHVEEVGKITSLLLGLSGRLARAENALYDMPADHTDRKTLESKRDKLIEQLEEAKILKSNIDRRSVNVSAIIAKYLNDEEFADYQHFINMKAKLIVDGREIQDKVKLGEEQLAALKEAIDL